MSVESVKPGAVVAVSTDAGRSVTAYVDPLKQGQVLAVCAAPPGLPVSVVFALEYGDAAGISLEQAKVLRDQLSGIIGDCCVICRAPDAGEYVMVLENPDADRDDGPRQHTVNQMLCPVHASEAQDDDLVLDFRPA